MNDPHRIHVLADKAYMEEKKHIYIFLLCMMMFLSACGEESRLDMNQTQSDEQQVLFGENNLVELHRAPQRWQDLGYSSVVALIPQARMGRFDDGSRSIGSGSLAGVQDDSGRGLCEDVPFRTQPRGAWCTGTLVDDDLVVTAGHCIPRGVCDPNLNFVFGFRMNKDNGVGKVWDEDVYTCSAVEYIVSSENGDVAFIRLDRPVESSKRKASPLRLDASPMITESPAVSLGHPFGLPIKLDITGKVKRSDVVVHYEACLDDQGRETDDEACQGSRETTGELVMKRVVSPYFFGIHADVFPGNSGGPIYDGNGELIGVTSGLISMSGRSGFDQFRKKGNCLSFNSFDEQDNDLFIQVSYIGLARQKACSNGMKSERLCGTRSNLEEN